MKVLKPVYLTNMQILKETQIGVNIGGFGVYTFLY